MNTAREPIASASVARSRTRMQRRIATAVIVVPIIGTVAAIAIAMRNGIGSIEIVSFAAMYLAAMGGTTIGFHRYFTHKSFETSRRMRIALAILGSMAAQGPLLFWVAMHRRHHSFSDRPGDPHSPHVEGERKFGTLAGLWHAHIGWMLSQETADWVNYARDLMRDRTVFRVHQTYFVWLTAGLLLPAIIVGLGTMSWRAAGLAFLWGGLVRMFVANQASWCVGSLCHYFGARPFDTHDHSANNYAVAVMTFGEGLQNNHHAFPSSAKHAILWWEPDFSWILIRLLALFGLVWDVRQPSLEAIARLRRA
jgi:stearoyl-CoA desaturase (delta-9 desaturase)